MRILMSWLIFRARLEQISSIFITRRINCKKYWKEWMILKSIILMISTGKLHSDLLKLRRYCLSEGNLNKANKLKKTQLWLTLCTQQIECFCWKEATRVSQNYSTNWINWITWFFQKTIWRTVSWRFLKMLGAHQLCKLLLVKSTQKWGSFLLYLNAFPIFLNGVKRKWIWRAFRNLWIIKQTKSVEVNIKT